MQLYKKLYKTTITITTIIVVICIILGTYLFNIKAKYSMNHGLNKTTQKFIKQVSEQKPALALAEMSLEDIYSGIEQLIKNMGHFNIQGPIIVGGDSSGASFALAALVKMRDVQSSEFKKINSIVLISPAVDLSMNQKTMKDYDDMDALFSLEVVKTVQNWLKDENFKDPIVSPIYTASFADLPPCRIIVAEYDRLRSHADSLYKKLLHDGVNVTALHVCTGQVHAFLNLRGVLNEGEDPAEILNDMITGNILQ